MTCDGPERLVVMIDEVFVGLGRTQYDLSDQPASPDFLAKLRLAGHLVPQFAAVGEDVQDVAFIRQIGKEAVDPLTVRQCVHLAALQRISPSNFFGHLPEP